MTTRTPDKRSSTDSEYIHLWGGVGGGIIVVMFGWIGCWILISVVAIATPGAILSAANVNNEIVALGIIDGIIFSMGYALFLSLGFWAAGHGVPVVFGTPVGEIMLTTVPLVDGLFEIVIPLLLVSGGYLGAALTDTRLVLVPFLATVTSVIGYVVTMVIAVVVSAFLFNILITIIAVQNQAALGVSAVMFHSFRHPSIVEMGMTLGRFSGPYIVGGVLLGTVIKATRSTTE